MTRGASQRCTTFDNEPLASNNGGQFECLRVEVWALKEVGHLANSSENGDQEQHKTEIILDGEI